ncbi:MAG TPA: hypothetical protein VGP24_14880 [Glaciihabitans sp.]|nr:hypothetical protein [Glaciihabitans sp.]
MQSELYADGIGEITVTGGIVRIDLVSLSHTERDAANQPVPVFRQRVVMSVEGFANSFEVMQKAMHGLIEGGAIRRTTPEESGLASPPRNNGSQTPNGSGPRQNGSPNFA